MAVHAPPYRWTVLALVGLMLAAAVLHREPFYASPHEVQHLVTTSPMNFHLWLQSMGPAWRLAPLHPTSEQLYEAFLHDVQETRSIPRAMLPETASASILVDPLDAHTWFRSRLRPLGHGPLGYFVVLMHPSRAIRIDCSYSLEGKRIGYFDRPEYNLLRAIQHGYRMRSDSMHLQKIPAAAWEMLLALFETQLDMAIAYVVPHSPFHALLKSQKIAVVGFQDINAERVRLFHPHVQPAQLDLQRMFTTSPSWALVPADEHTAQVFQLRLGIYHVQGTQSTAAPEGFITRLALHPESEDPGFRCYGDPSITTRLACESPVDPIGLPKRGVVASVWDRPCFEDKDCPFFRANRNYPNSRGGCHTGGICEMPLGVRRLGYRKYDATDKHTPFCYYCDDPRDPECCEKQKDRTQYWDLNSPDLAFEDDREARKAAGRVISLPMK